MDKAEEDNFNDGYIVYQDDVDNDRSINVVYCDDESDEEEE